MMMYSIAVARDDSVHFTLLLEADSFELASNKLIDILRDYGKLHQKDNPHHSTEFWYLHPCYQYRFTEFTMDFVSNTKIDYHREWDHREYVYWEKDGELKSRYREVDGW